MRLPPGSTFAETFRIVEFVGKGGWADVYEAIQNPFQRRVAVKILHAHLSTEPEKLERFRREAKAASLLKHPNICQVYDFGTAAEGQPYCAMEFVDGSTLRDILGKRGKLPATEALPMFIAVCDALAAAHDAGVLHRDIKPSNIMIDKSGKPVLLDFGVAKVSDEESGTSEARLTATGVTIGTPTYMSPEQCLGRPSEPRSDIYSLACVIYEALSGSPPIDGDSDMMIMHAHVHNEIKPLPRKLNLKPTIEQTISAALSKSPEDRPANARTFARQLAGTEAPLPAVKPPVRKVNTFVPATAGAVLLTLAIIGGSIWFMQQHQKPKVEIRAEPTVAEYFAEAKHAFENSDLKHGRQFVEQMVAAFQRDPSKVDTSGLDNIIECIHSANYRADTQEGIENRGTKLLQSMINTLAMRPKPDEALLVHLQIALAEMYITQDTFPDIFTPDFLYSPFVYKADTILSRIIPTLPDNRRDMATDVTRALLQKARICDLNSHWLEAIELVDRYERVYKQNGMTESGRLQQAILFKACAYIVDNQIDKGAAEFDRALKIYPGIWGVHAADQASVYHTAAQAYLFIGDLDRAKENVRLCVEQTKKLGNESKQQQLLRGLSRWGLMLGFSKEYISNTKAMMRPYLLAKNPHPIKEVWALPGRPVSDADVQKIPNPGEVTVLDLAATSITDGVAPILSRFPNLQSLSVRINDVGNPTARAAAKLPRLKSLDISCSFIDDKGLTELLKSKSIVDLSLAYTAVTNEGMSTLAKMPSLAILNLRNTLINDAGLENLAGAKKLRRVWLHENPLLHGTSFRKLPQLQALIVGDPRTTTIDVSGIRGMHSLQVLELPATPITDDMLTFLPEMTNLEEVNLACTGIGDKTVSNLVKLPKLHKLNLNHTNITQRSIEMLAACKPLKELRIGQTTVGDISALKARKDLTVITPEYAAIGPR